MFEAMLRGWRAQQTARGLREDTIVPRERLVRRFGEFTNEYPWAWSAGHMDEWSLHLTAERHLAPSTIRAYQGSLRLFSETKQSNIHSQPVSQYSLFVSHSIIFPLPPRFQGKPLD